MPQHMARRAYVLDTAPATMVYRTNRMAISNSCAMPDIGVRELALVGRYPATVIPLDSPVLR